jgi:uncharacterized repeat protein (TIGR01451 family)
MNLQMTFRGRIQALIIGILVIGAFIALGSRETQGHSVPPFVDGSVPSSAVCTDFVLDLGLIDVDIPDPGWVWVNAGNPGLPQYRSVSGVVTKSKVTHTDFPAVHDSHDQNTDIFVDPGYEDLLSDAGKDDDGDGLPDTIEMEWEIGTFPDETGSDPERLFPKWAWPNEGDRVWTDGHWIFDCGHPEDMAGTPHARTEIHPARAIASMRDQVSTLPGSGTTPVPVTATDLYIHGRAGFVTDTLNCGMDIIADGGECTPYPHTATPIEEDFEFDICLPPLPFDKAALATFVEDGPGNTVDIAPIVDPVPATGACAGAGFGPTQIHVTVPLAGSGVSADDVYARKINAGWVFPAETLKHLKLTLNRMDLHDDHETDPGDCECTFFWMNVDKAPSNEWIRLSTYADGNMNDYDDDEGLGDGEMDFTGAEFDFYVADGEPYTVRANGYDQDCLDDYFGDHSFDITTFLDCYLLAAIELNPGDNDAFASLTASFGAPGYGIGNQDVTASGEYELEFTVEEIPLGTGDEDTADLSLSKVCKPDDTVLAGEEITCTIIVQNDGPALPRNVVVDDVLLTDVADSDYTLEPPTFTFPGVGFSDPCEAIEDVPGGKEFRCEIGSVPVGGKAIITGKITSQEGGDFNNLARVFTDSTDPNPDNNADEDGVTVVPVADLQVCKADTAGAFLCTTNASAAAGPDPVNAGESLTYEIEVVNTGPSTATNVVVEDNLPDLMSVISVVASSGACNAGTPGDPSDPTRCHFDTLPSGGSRIMRVVAEVDPDAVTDVVTDELIIQNDTWVSSDTFDPDNSNDLASEDTTVQASADLMLAKFAVGAPIAGTDIHYEYQISNLGPSVSRDVTLRDFLPDEVEVVSAFIDTEGGSGGVPLPCTITVGSGALFCPLGDIAPTDGVPIIVFVNVHIDASVPDGTSVTNSADVSLTDTPDPDPSNNSDSATVVVQAVADLVMIKTADSDTYKASAVVIYELAVTNNGPSDAQGVVVVDDLPIRHNDRVFWSNPFSCTKPADSTTLTCNIGTVGAGETKVVTRIIVQFRGSRGIVSNTADVSTTTFDPNLVNNSSTLEVLIGKLPKP